jgi:hypothetical protein
MKKLISFLIMVSIGAAAGQARERHFSYTESRPVIPPRPAIETPEPPEPQGGTVNSNLRIPSIFALVFGDGQSDDVYVQKTSSNTITVHGNLTCTGGTCGAVSIPALSSLSDTTITTPANNDLLTYSTADSKWENKPIGVQPYRFSGFVAGTYTTSQVLFAVPVGSTVTFAANFSGSQAVLQAAATASTVFIINKIISGTPTQIGSITCGISATVCTFTSSSGLTQSLASGNVLEIVAPASADTTAGALGFLLLGTS